MSAPVAAAKKWYIVHTYSGFEEKVREGLEQKIRTLGKADLFGEILIPSENLVEMRKGKKRSTTRKFFPGYVLVKMVFNEETWHIVRSVPKVTGFVGGMKDPSSEFEPPSVPEEEVRRLTEQIQGGQLSARVQVEEGDNVRVIEGPFANFNGVVEEVNPDKARVRVLVAIFGRATPVELDFNQVEKV